MTIKQLASILLSYEQFYVYSNDFLAFVIDICIPLFKDQNIIYEICSLAICINIKTFNRVNRKQLNNLITFLEYLEFYIVAY